MQRLALLRNLNLAMIQDQRSTSYVNTDSTLILEHRSNLRSILVSILNQDTQKNLPQPQITNTTHSDHIATHI